MINTIINSDCISAIKTIPDCYVNCVVTSPPYYGLRDYGHVDQIGIEDQPEEYIEKLVCVFKEIRRILKDDGTLWINIGDSYASSSGGKVEQTLRGDKDYVNRGQKGVQGIGASVKPPKGLKAKDLIGIPWMLAFALRKDGWYLRQDIIWNKPNPMPESVKDRCTKNHEYIFLLSKQQNYYYDYEAIKEELADPYRTNFQCGARTFGINDDRNDNDLSERSKLVEYNNKNKRSVWTVNTKPYMEAHFATYPEELIMPCILAGCPVGGIVFDPFMGSGTTAVVAAKNKRNYIGSELSEKYIQIAEKRIREETAQQTLF